MFHFTKQEQFVLFIVVLLLLMGAAGKYYRASHAVADVRPDGIRNKL